MFKTRIRILNRREAEGLVGGRCDAGQAVEVWKSFLYRRKGMVADPKLGEYSTFEELKPRILRVMSTKGFKSGESFLFCFVLFFVFSRKRYPVNYWVGQKVHSFFFSMMTLVVLSCP